MDIAIDFDGTCLTHEFPELGKDIGAIPVLKKLVDKGHRLILWTMRSDSQEKHIFDEGYEIYAGNFLTQAVNWFKDNNIELYGIQRNPEQDIWTSSLKAYAQLYIDDAALGCPLSKEPLIFEEKEFLEKYGYSCFLSPPNSKGLCNYDVYKPYVNWKKVEEMLTDLKIL